MNGHSIAKPCADVPNTMQRRKNLFFLHFRFCRELFELRKIKNEGHEKDFLTVGCMGHASSIALGIAVRKPNRKIFVLDGDGAMIMHMGVMATVAQYVAVLTIISNELI